MAKFQQGNRRNAKLGIDAVHNIRSRYESGVTQGQLARDYGMSANQIGRIVRGESWADLPRPQLDSYQLDAMAKRIWDQTHQEQSVLGRVQQEVKEARQEMTPGETKADKLLEELEVIPKPKVEISEDMRRRMEALGFKQEKDDV